MTSVVSLGAIALVAGVGFATLGDDPAPVERPVVQAQLSPRPAARVGATNFTDPRLALITPQNSIDRVVQTSAVDQSAALRSGWKWLPIPAVAPPSFDPTTEVRTGNWPTLIVGANSVTETYPKRLKTAQELDDDKTNSVENADAIILRVLCNHENRIRAVTPSPPPQLTLAQCKAAIKGMIP